MKTDCTNSKDIVQWQEAKLWKQCYLCNLVTNLPIIRVYPHSNRFEFIL